jgi:hypothetical protein
LVVADHQLAPVTLAVDLGAAVLVEVPRVGRRRIQRQTRIITRAYDTGRAVLPVYTVVTVLPVYFHV